MEDIIDMLVQAIEEGTFPCFFTKSEYRRNQHCVGEHFQWLEENLSEEAKEHLEKARDAEGYMDVLEREAMVRTALAVGIRLALPR